MWQRWNNGTKIFEKSSDNGASWSPLGLNASIITEGAFAKAQLPASVAYEDEVNTFAALNYLNGNVELNNTAPSIYFNDSDEIAHSRRWMIHCNSQLLQFWSLYDDGNLISRVFNIDRAGHCTSAGAMRANQWFYEGARGFPLGHRLTDWVTVGFTAEGAAIGGGIGSRYSIIGNMLFWSVYVVNYNIPAATGFLKFTVPGGYSAVDAGQIQNPCRIYAPGVGDEIGFVQMNGGWLEVFRCRANFAAGVGHFIGEGFFWIA